MSHVTNAIQSLSRSGMEEGTKHKKTIFIGGISDDTDETILYEAFSTFGMSNSPSFRCTFHVN